MSFLKVVFAVWTANFVSMITGLVIWWLVFGDMVKAML